MKSKKFWSWTEKQRRKTRTQDYYGSGVPKSYRKWFDRRYRNTTKKEIKKELDGIDGIFPTRTRRHEALWCYW